MPIHPGCDCGVESLGVGEHLDQVIDPALLESVHDQVQGLTGMSDRSGRAVDYRQLIVTHEHGEYGPTIAWKGQKFTGPDEVAAWSAGVQAGTIRLEGDELDARRRGFWDGRQRVTSDTATLTARQRVAYAVGRAEGLLLPAVSQDATQPPPAATLIQQHQPPEKGTP